ncbi:PVC-type heme-binding CxxCH protein [Stieleria mannarensis]|uniref:PVC-type heme-binding CxxCH protein n=1 Tax=Stieleria mannarensis TaxID=2755585 RepID=UPI0016023E78|nr:PVC-type heme-binding CxxCH protein [Rhodopirellula sp. JC639]
MKIAMEDVNQPFEDQPSGASLRARSPLSLVCLGLALAFGFPVVAAAQQRLPKKQHRTSDAPFLTPDEAVKKMSIPDGFDVSIFAAEPDLAEPIAFCFDDRGRMWVVENLNYRTRREHTDDKVSRIQILEDTDSDGVFDKKTTFADDLTFTSGIAVGFGGVYVGSPPNFSFIPDADGDDRPDGPPQVLLDGWGINDRHETLNSFIWGPDGWLYGCHGVFTQSRVGKPGEDDARRQFIDGGIWRFHPVTKKYEVFARGLSNPWGFDFDKHGQGFATCCVIPHLFHVVQGGVYTKQSRPHINPHIYDDITTIRDHTHLSAHGGARFYLADAFPQQYHDRLFMCNIHEHCVLTDVMVPNGSSFIGKHGDDFLPTNDLAWVGFSVEIGPEGGVYILDWHDTDICGNAINFPQSGRIYRIMPEGSQPIARPNLRSLSDSELIAMQWHTNDWYVRQARVLLHARAADRTLDPSATKKQLKEMFRTADTSPRRLRTLWAAHVTGVITSQELTDLLDHDDHYVRAWAIQLLSETTTVDAFFLADVESSESSLAPTVRNKFAAMAKHDDSPIVRLYLASALQRLPLADRWPILEQLAMHAEDANDNNLARMYWFALEPMVPEFPERSLALAVKGKLSNLQEFVARRLATGDVAEESDPNWRRVVAQVAPGFDVRDVGEGGIVHHKVFRNRSAVQTHPKDRHQPCRMFRDVKLPADKATELQLRVSHHPHGDWQLRVLVGKDVLADQTVSSSTVANDEWLDVTVDLSKYAGQQVRLTLENRANDWHNEWAYWNEVKLVSR